MSNYFLTPATAELAANLAPNLRKEDADEVYAAIGYPAEQVLPFAVTLAPGSQAALDSEGVIAMWGVQRVSTLSGLGHPWLLGTPRMVRKYQRDFLKLSRLIAENMRSEYDVLQNFVDARNRVSIRWLTWMGFDVEAIPRPFGPFGLPFHEFYWRK